MVVLPSFGPEYCVSVYAEISEDTKKKQGGLRGVPPEEKTYVVIVSKASESLWGWMNKKNRKEPVNDIHVAHKARAISMKLAVSIQRVWARALHLTRYPTGATDFASIETDGTTYRFSVFVAGLGDLHGQCHNPRIGLAKDLTEVAHELRNLVEPDEASVPLTENQLIERLEKMEATIPKTSLR